MGVKTYSDPLLHISGGEDPQPTRIYAPYYEHVTEVMAVSTRSTGEDVTTLRHGRVRTLALKSKTGDESPAVTVAA